MQKVVAVDSGAVAPLAGKGRLPVAYPDSAFTEGVVQGALAPGRYNVTLENGSMVQVRGAAVLKPGDRVQVLTSQLPQGPEPAQEEAIAALDNGSVFSAFIPLAFGGAQANAKLEVQVERKAKEVFKKGSAPVYFVFVVQTEGQGEVQWGIHLKGRQMALQVYGPQLGREKGKLESLVDQVERALASRGFAVTGQVIYSKHPLRLPSGQGLNVKG